LKSEVENDEVLIPFEDAFEVIYHQYSAPIASCSTPNKTKNKNKKNKKMSSTKFRSRKSYPTF
jgi:hypothetical protein